MLSQNKTLEYKLHYTMNFEIKMVFKFKQFLRKMYFKTLTTPFSYHKSIVFQVIFLQQNDP